jgi:hypothetical protein
LNGLTAVKMATRKAAWPRRDGFVQHGKVSVHKKSKQRLALGGGSHAESLPRIHYHIHNSVSLVPRDRQELYKICSNLPFSGRISWARCQALVFLHVNAEECSWVGIEYVVVEVLSSRRILHYGLALYWDRR